MDELKKTLIAAFHEHAKKDGDSETLSKGEMKDLLRVLLSEDIEQSGVDELFEALDNDKDGKVDLKEYMALINALFE